MSVFRGLSLHRSDLPQLDFRLEDGLELGEEPTIDIRHLPNLLNGISAMEGSRNGEDALVCGVLQLFVDILNEIVLREVLTRSRQADL